MDSQSESTRDGSGAPASATFELKPLKRAHPPLWIRRIAIWDGKDKLNPRREIEFKTGLNIISTTPPGRSETDGNSYNVGKTALRGLILYCLGATHFGSDKLEGQIRKAFRNGAVTAEVIIDGKPWLIIRGFGSKRLTSVQQGSDLSELWCIHESKERLGIEAYIQAIKSALGLDVAKFGEMKPQELAFQTAISLLTRDHVVGFRDVLHWSNSRTREAIFPREMREKLLLALLGMSTESLPDFKATGSDLATKAADAQKHRLAQKLHAKLRLSKSVRGNREAAAEEIGKRLKEADNARKDAIANQQAAQIRLTIAELQKQLSAAEKALLDGCTICPLTKKKISSLIDQGCLLKNAGCEPEAARAKVQQIGASLREAQAKLRKVKPVEDGIPETEADVDERLKQARLERDRWDKLAEERTKTWNERRAEKASLGIYDSLFAKADASQQQTEDTSARSTEDATQLEVSAKNDAGLASAFQRVVAQLISQEAVGKLDGLEPRIEVPADRLAQGAMEKIAGDRGALLGVLSFDFAVLVHAMEKKICVPPILVHDSPRLQDLDKMSYSRLFWLARSLEIACGAPPLFQYIIMTSTPPPPKLDCDEWCRLRLDGGKPHGEGRLFVKVF